MAFWNRQKQAQPALREHAPEERISASDPITADHWIVRRIEALESSGGIQNADVALRQVAVYACVRVLAETIASLPLAIYKRTDTGKEQARDHPLFSLLHESPNNFQTSLEFFETLITHLNLRGNAYSFLERNGRGIARIIPIHPDRVQPKLVDPVNHILRFEVSGENGTTETFEARDIWHLKGLSSDGFVGLSPIQMAARAVQLNKVVEDHGISYFKNGARASGIAKLPGTLKPDAKLRLQDSIQSGMTGENKFRVLVFEQGMEWQSVSLTNEDSQYLETRNFQIEEIARLFRVPSILIGHPDKASTYASAEQFMLSFVTHTIRPWLVRIEQSINMYLLGEDRRTYFSKFNVEGLLRGDTATRYESYMKGRQAEWLSVNEIRELEDRDPIDGGNVYANPSINPQKGTLGAVSNGE